MKKILFVFPLLIISLLAKTQNCPTLRVIAPTQVTAGESLNFVADVKGTTDNITYNWSISAGAITSGQGTSSITVNTDSLGGMDVTATVELGGVPPNCSAVSSSTVMIMEEPKKILSFTYSTTALNTSVKKFIQQSALLSPDNNKMGFIYVYKGATTTDAQLKQMHAAIEKAFEKNLVLTYQYKIADGGRKKVATVDMYTMLPGAKEPLP